MNLSPIDRVYAHVPVTAKLADGTPATLAGVDVAVQPYRTPPDDTTVWTAASYSNGAAVVLLAGPDADPTGALPVPAATSDLWIRVTDNPEIQAVRVGVITVS